MEENIAYAFEQSDSSVQDAFRRIALEQFDYAIGVIDDQEIGREKTVHEARKCCKRLRGLIRLVRPGFKGFEKENAAIRDAAKRLSHLRDAGVLLQTLDGLCEHYGDQIDPSIPEEVRTRLSQMAEKTQDDSQADASIAAFREDMAGARERTQDWNLKEDGFDAIEGGLSKVYARAMKSKAKALEERDGEAFHDWRKFVKYHWYHACLLTPIWPGSLKAHSNAADELGDLLGTHHDLEVFKEVLNNWQNDSSKGKASRDKKLQVLSDLAGRRQAALEYQAEWLGTRLFAEPTKSLCRRWRIYWEAWRREAAEDS